MAHLAFITPVSPFAPLSTRSKSLPSLQRQRLCITRAVLAPPPMAPPAQPKVSAAASAAPRKVELPDCPPTVWDVSTLLPNASAAFAAVQRQYAKDIPSKWAPAVWECKEKTTGGSFDAARTFVLENKQAMLSDLRKTGAVWLKGILPADGQIAAAAGISSPKIALRDIYEILGLVPCMDPIHTSGLRKMVNKNDGIYETVNKESLANHYVGLHNESTFTKSSYYGAFVCYKKATKGGEFLLLDGKSMIRDLDKDVVAKMMEKKVRISVANLDFDFMETVVKLVPALKGVFSALIAAIVAPKFDMELEMVWGADGKQTRLQAIEPPQFPVIHHRLTGEPVWFCNVHNHARYLRDRRPCTVPEIGMTDVYYGDLSRIEPEVLSHVDEITRKNIVEVDMQPGDVVLLDNYRVLHGRNIFQGERFHAVTWFGKALDEPDQLHERNVTDPSHKTNKPVFFLNEIVNKLFVK